MAVVLVALELHWQAIHDMAAAAVLLDILETVEQAVHILALAHMLAAHQRQIQAVQQVEAKQQAAAALEYLAKEAMAL